MRTLLLPALVACSFLFCGCAFHKTAIVTAPIGPPPQAQHPNGTNGTLVVHSARDPHSDLQELPFLVPHTDYEIHSSEGALVQKVHNSTDAVIEQPARVDLAEGSYRVDAHANHCQKVTVPVVIRAGQVTMIDLEALPSVQNDIALAQSNPVRLPKGQIVGWRADTATESKQ